MSAAHRDTTGRPARGLVVLFAVVYFAQGLGSPTDGLLVLPVYALLEREGFGAQSMATFMGIAALPWALKPLLGLVCDRFAVFGRRRKSWLALASGASAAAFAGLFAVHEAAPASEGGQALWLVLALLVTATLGVAWADVATDAAMVEAGRPLGITGRLQAVQWAAMYAATLVAGVVGGWLAGDGRMGLAFAVSGALAAIACALAVFGMREAPAPRGVRVSFDGLWAALRTPPLPAVAAFLALWSFNPFGNTVLYVHWTGALGFDELFYGWTLSALGLGALTASAAYGALARRLSSRALVQLTIVFGIGATLWYAGVDGPIGALLASFAVGFCYLVATLTQLELAARACPPAWAGTIFAGLMAATNVSSTAGDALGGAIYDAGAPHLGARGVFALLVVLGCASSAVCWLLVPWLARDEARARLDDAERDDETVST